jgi:hypothetical protein
MASVKGLRKKVENDEDDIFNTATASVIVKKNNKAKENIGKYMPYLAVQEDGSAIVRFLDDEPITFYQHRIYDPSMKEGLGGHRNLTCTRKDCPICGKGDRPRWVGAYRVIHIDHMEKGKQVPTEKIFIKGVNVIEVLERKNQKKALSSENIEIERIGTGFDTKYTFDFTGDKKPIKDFVAPEDDDLRERFKINREDLERLSKTMGKKGKSSAEDDD